MGTIDKQYNDLRSALMRIEVNLDSNKRKELDKEIRLISKHIGKEASKLVIYEHYNDPDEFYYYCPNCNEELNEKDEDAYCRYCGQYLLWR